jgi:hypothetical protein
VAQDKLSQSNSFVYNTIIGFAFLFIFITETNAQRYLSSFGKVTNIKITGHYSSLLNGDFNGDGRADIAAIGKNEIHLFYQSDDGFSFTEQSIKISGNILAAAAGKLNQDKLADFVVIVDDPLTLQAFVSKPSRKYTRSWNHPLIEPSTNILIDDISNDHKSDIILYGKRELGATVYPGNGNGTFQQNITLFSEYSFTSFAVIQSNDDDLNDIIAADWISNQILTYTAFGKMNFSEPTVIHCDGSPVFITTGLLDRDTNNDFLISYSDARLCDLFSGDGMGGYIQSVSVTLSVAPSEIALQDVNGDGKKDIVMLSGSNSTIIVKLNDGNGRFEEETPFYAGEGPLSFTIFQYPRSTRFNIAILDTASQIIRVMYPSTIRTPNAEVQTFGVGRKPSSIICTDVNRDRYNDVIVANEESQTISILPGAAGNSLEGQITFRVSQSPSLLRYYSVNDTLGVLTSTSVTSKDISVLEINRMTLSSRMYTLPTQGTPEVLTLTHERNSVRFQILVLERDYSNSTSSLINFEKISGNKFTQQVAPLTTPKIQFLDASFDSNGNSYLIYGVFDPRQNVEAIYQTQYVQPCQILPPRLVYSFQTKRNIPLLVWYGNANDDQRPDILYHLGEPENKLYLMNAINDTTFSPPYLLSGSPVTITSKDHLQIIDCNNDGKKDIAYMNASEDNVEVCSGNGIYSTTSILSNAGTGDEFVISKIKNDSTYMLIMTDSVSGTVSIMPLGTKLATNSTIDR